MQFSLISMTLYMSVCVNYLESVSRRILQRYPTRLDIVEKNEIKATSDIWQVEKNSLASLSTRVMQKFCILVGHEA